MQEPMKILKHKMEEWGTVDQDGLYCMKLLQDKQYDTYGAFCMEKSDHISTNAENFIIAVVLLGIFIVFFCFFFRWGCGR